MTLRSDLDLVPEPALVQDVSQRPRVTAVPGGWQAGVAAAVAGWLLRRSARGLGVAIRTDGEISSTADGPAIVVSDPTAFYRRIGTHRLLGFGESYMAAEWYSPDLAATLTALASAMTRMVPAPVQQLRVIRAKPRPTRQRGTVANARANIAHHYDLSNELFESFLDETLTYSSAMFAAVEGVEGYCRGCEVSHLAPPSRQPIGDELATAQRRKIDRLLDLAGVQPGTELLEIGTGWGELCLRAAARGASVRSVTLSTEQRALALRRVADAGLSSAVTIDLMDYRMIEGGYDAIVSLEMIEAVGHHYWDTYFQILARLLNPGGRVALQAITMPHDRMLAARDSYTWIDKHIFPGGQVPSVEAIETAAAKAGLRLTQRCRFGAHYAETLRLWRQRFTDYGTVPAGIADTEAFRRMWQFYLAYCEAGFRSGQLDVQQMRIEKGN